MFEELLDAISPWALVVGAVIVGRPLLGKALRPAAKGAIRGYLAMADGARAAVEEARQSVESARKQVESIVDEARVEKNGH